MAREQPLVARDFLGIAMNRGDMGSADVVMGKQNFSPGADHSTSPLLNNIMAMAGVKSSSWSKAATMQHFLPLRGSTDERFKEQIAENLPERSFPHVLHPLQMQDLANNNQNNGLHTQGDLLINISAQVREEYGSSVPMAGGKSPGLSTRNMISASKPEAMTVSGIPAASEMRLPLSGMQHDPPLTIFYGGSVKVFNNISAERAEAIMILASTGNGEGNPADLMASASAAVKCINSMATPACPHDKSLKNLHSNQVVVNVQPTKANQVNQFTTNMQLDLENLNIPVPSSPVPSAGQPMVPTALPHARKASLARFLEKRRERAHSKCPYSVMRREDSSLPEERLSSSNDPTCYSTLCSDRTVDKKKNLIPSWMERVAECSTSDVVVKEQKITAI